MKDGNVTARVPGHDRRHTIYFLIDCFETPETAASNRCLFQASIPRQVNRESLDFGLWSLTSNLWPLASGLWPRLLHKDKLGDSVPS